MAVNSQSFRRLEWSGTGVGETEWSRLTWLDTHTHQSVTRWRHLPHTCYWLTMTLILGLHRNIVDGWSTQRRVMCLTIAQSKFTKYNWKPWWKKGTTRVRPFLLETVKILKSTLFIVTCSDCLSAEFVGHSSTSYNKIGRHLDLIRANKTSSDALDLFEAKEHFNLLQLSK